MIGLNTNETEDNKAIVKSVQNTVKGIIEFILLLTIFVILLYLPALLQIVNQSVQ